MPQEAGVGHEAPFLSVQGEVDQERFLRHYLLIREEIFRQKAAYQLLDDIESADTGSIFYELVCIRGSKNLFGEIVCTGVGQNMFGQLGCEVSGEDAQTLSDNYGEWLRNTILALFYLMVSFAIFNCWIHVGERLLFFV